jgi:hypothetical protein
MTAGLGQLPTFRQHFPKSGSDPNFWQYFLKSGSGEGNGMAITRLQAKSMLFEIPAVPPIFGNIS